MSRVPPAKFSAEIEIRKKKKLIQGSKNGLSDCVFIESTDLKGIGNTCILGGPVISFHNIRSMVNPVIVLQLFSAETMMPNEDPIKTESGNLSCTFGFFVRCLSSVWCTPAERQTTVMNYAACIT